VLQGHDGAVRSLRPPPPDGGIEAADRRAQEQRAADQREKPTAAKHGVLPTDRRPFVHMPARLTLSTARRLPVLAALHSPSPLPKRRMTPITSHGDNSALHRTAALGARKATGFRARLRLLSATIRTHAETGQTPSVVAGYRIARGPDRRDRARV